MENKNMSFAENLLIATKVVAYTSTSILVIITAICMSQLTGAGLTVLLSPDYNCTPVEVKDPV